MTIYFQVCEYYAHIECQDFAIADCKENATYVPGKELLSFKHVHHWREGNLPQSSKCAYCKKTCWSSECLTGELIQSTRCSINIQSIKNIILGYRCEWCGFTSHGGCRHYVPQECTFGINQPIYLPPHAVSIPRTEVPMEAIIGVQVKTKGAPMTREYSCRKSHASLRHSSVSFYLCFIISFKHFFGSVNVFGSRNKSPHS